MREPDALDAVRVVAFALLAVAGVGLLVQAGMDQDLGLVLQGISFFAVPILYARMAKLSPLGANGFFRITARQAALVLLASIATLWILKGVFDLQTIIFRRLDLMERTKAEEETIVRGIDSIMRTGTFVTVGLLAVIVPLCEETLFRGILFRGLTSRFGALFATAATATLFAVFHGSLVQFVLMVFLGVYFGVLVRMTGSLWSSVIAHGLNNLAVVGLNIFYGPRVEGFIAPWWMVALSAVVFGLAMTLLSMERRVATG
jgi:membrane protease YdiL (CAAX protease family)